MPQKPDTEPDGSGRSPGHRCNPNNPSLLADTAPLSYPEPTLSTAATPTTPVPGAGDYATFTFAYFAVGVTVSVAMVEAGVSAARTMTAALLIYSATTQLAYLAVQAADGSALVGVLSGWLVASRFGILASSLGSRYEGPPLERAAAAVNCFDPNVALAIQQAEPDNVRRVFWRVTASLMIGWWTGCVVGILLGNVTENSAALGLDAVFPAALLAIIGALLRRRDGLTAALLGAAICVMAIPFTPGGVPILLSALGAAAAFLLARKTSTEDAP